MTMPIYAYSCTACGQELELLQPMQAPAPDSCAVCGAVGALRKQVTAAAFRLRGSGWYETDFKTGKKSNLDSGDDAGGAETSSPEPAAGASAASGEGAAGKSEKASDSATQAKAQVKAKAKVKVDAKPSPAAKTDT